MSSAALGRDLTGTVGENRPRETELRCLGEDVLWAGYFCLIPPKVPMVKAAREEELGGSCQGEGLSRGLATASPWPLGRDGASLYDSVLGSALSTF